MQPLEIFVPVVPMRAADAAEISPWIAVIASPLPCQLWMVSECALRSSTIGP